LTEEKDAALEEANQNSKRYEDASVAATNLRQELESLESSCAKLNENVTNQQKTISLLVSEKASLAADLERLEQSENGTHIYV
jgi:hypothetical protein